MNSFPAAGGRALGRGGLTVGPVAFGAAPIGNLGAEVTDSDAEAAIARAWDLGIRYFDVAPHYGLGLAEERLGRALSRYPRDEYIVSTKVGRVLKTADGPMPDTEGYVVAPALVRRRDYSRDGVLRSLEQSLSRLGLDRIDLVFVHDPDNHYREALEGAFPALDELRSADVITSYGAGMNASAMLADFVRNTDADVMMCAGRYTLIDQSALDDLMPLAIQREVSIVAAAIFNSGILARDRPREGAWYDYAPASEELLRTVNLIADACERNGTALPQAAARFPLLHPAVATICVGARTAEQMTRNADLLGSDVDAALWMELKANDLLRADAPTG